MQYLTYAAALLQSPPVTAIMIFSHSTGFSWVSSTAPHRWRGAGNTQELPAAPEEAKLIFWEGININFCLSFTIQSYHPSRIPTIPPAFTFYKGIELKYSDARHFHLKYYYITWVLFQFVFKIQGFKRWCWDLLKSNSVSALSSGEG